MKMEAAPGFEPGYEGFADPCLTTWLCRLWSGRRDLNPRHSAWEADALPLSYSRLIAYACILHGAQASVKAIGLAVPEVKRLVRFVPSAHPAAIHAVLHTQVPAAVQRPWPGRGLDTRDGGLP